jgi:hypothetical protein
MMARDVEGARGADGVADDGVPSLLESSLELHRDDGRVLDNEDPRPRRAHVSFPGVKWMS